jgi:hypothetical protein
MVNRFTTAYINKWRSKKYIIFNFCKEVIGWKFKFRQEVREMNIHNEWIDKTNGTSVEQI